ncbi:MAG TPA: dihydrodipicolinate synthase family protein [Galbitalea sp.]|jgi:4-hydroxy-tetrahydrodipicolinate synthase|nr:dihydrodipicolinate synthase family protein [Galbitalea sp.]
MTGNSHAKEWARETLKGLFTSPMVPMNDDGSIDYDGIRHNVEFLIDSKVDGIGFGFSEPWYLTLEERRKAFETLVTTIGGRVPCYLHALDYSVPETIDLVNYAGELGADAVMLWTPMEFAKSQEMIGDWFEYVCSNVSLPVIAYNTYHSGINMTIETIDRIANIENVGALKDAVNDFGHTIAAMQAVGDRIVVSNPLEKHLPAMKMYMNQQVMMGATSVFLMQSPRWQPLHDYVAAIDAGENASAWEQFYALDGLRDVWNSIYEPLWNKSAALHPIPLIKHWMDLIGMRGGSVRPPMHKLTQADRDALTERLEATGLLEKLSVA